MKKKLDDHVTTEKAARAVDAAAPISREQKIMKQMEYELKDKLSAFTKEYGLADEPKVVSAILRIYDHVVTEGMNLAEAIEYQTLRSAEPVKVDKYVNDPDKYPMIAELFRLGELDYKRSLMRRTGVSEKTAHSILEARYPEEYGTNKKNSGSSDVGEAMGALKGIFELIQGQQEPMHLTAKKVKVIDVDPNLALIDKAL